jgi:hypothetical protein
MGRRKGSLNKPKGDKPQPASAIGKMISAKRLKELVQLKKSAKEDSDACTESARDAINNAIKGENLHRKAFGIALAADKMEPEALADYFAHRDYYEASLGLRKRSGSVMRMDFDEKSDDAAESNVATFPTAGRA